MLLLCFVIHILLVLSAADYHQNRPGRTELRGIKNGVAKAMLTRGLRDKNKTLIHREENLIRVPHKVIENTHRSLKTIKSPPRTIQKIIRKNKKFRKASVKKAKVTTLLPRKEESREYTTEEVRRRRNGKPRRAPKVVRNKKFHFENHKRNRRNARELYILKDFDEIEFVKNKKGDDYEEVKAHVKKYW